MFFDNNIPKELEKSEPVQYNVSNVSLASTHPREPMSVKKYPIDVIKQKICEIFKENCLEALTIVMYESGFRADAISQTNDWGLFQINCRWHSKRVGGNCNKLLDPDVNIAIARQIYLEQGWKPWATKIYLVN